MSMRNTPQLFRRKSYNKINLRLYSAYRFVSTRRVVKNISKYRAKHQLHAAQFSAKLWQSLSYSRNPLPLEYSYIQSTVPCHGSVSQQGAGFSSSPIHVQFGAKWHRNGVFCKACTSAFPLSVSVHQCSILMRSSVTDATYRTQSWQLTASLK
jgi:hypothetical protein